MVCWHGRLDMVWRKEDTPPFTEQLMDSPFSIQNPWSYHCPKSSEIPKPKYPMAPPTAIWAKGSHIPLSSHCPTSGHSNHIEPAYSPVEAQAALTSFKNVQSQTRAIPQPLSPIQDRIACWHQLGPRMSHILPTVDLLRSPDLLEWRIIR